MTGPKLSLINPDGRDSNLPSSHVLWYCSDDGNIFIGGIRRVVREIHVRFDKHVSVDKNLLVLYLDRVAANRYTALNEILVYLFFAVPHA